MAEHGTDYGTSGRTTIVRATSGGRLIFGLVMLALGVLWTLDNLGLTDAGAILRWWPALLLALGLARLTGIGARRSIAGGTVFTVIGALLLLDSLGLVRNGLSLLWPALLIVAGVAIVMRSVRAAPVAGESGEAGPYPRLVALLGGVSSRAASNALQGAEVSAVMGGVALDLRGAKPATQPLVVDAFAWWGGIELVVPESWRVICEVTPVMGGVEDETHPTGENAVTLIVRGVVIMGGLSLRNEPSERMTYVGVHRVRRWDRRGPSEVQVGPTGVRVTRPDQEVRVGFEGIHVSRGGTPPGPGGPAGSGGAPGDERQDR